MNTASPRDSGRRHTGGPLTIHTRSIRRHWLVVAIMALVALIASIAWVLTRTTEYEATAQVLVTPLATDDQTYFGLQLLRDTGDDPTRVLKTASIIVQSPEAATRTSEALGNGWTPQQVLDHISVTPETQSSILEVTGTDTSAVGAARLANTFTRAALNARTAALQEQIADTLSGLRARQVELEQGGTTNPGLTARINQLEAISQSEDPTVSIAQVAEIPMSTAGPSDLVVVILSLLAGFSLGVGAAILLEIFSSRIRDEEEAVALFPLPVLARVPLLSRSERRVQDQANTWAIAPAIYEAFRTVFIQLMSTPVNEEKAIMVTSASTGDGKTTSSINLAVSMAAANHKVALIDFDLRKPDIARKLGLQDVHSIDSLATADLGGDGFESLLAEVSDIPNLSVLATRATGDPDIFVVESLYRRLPELMKAAKAHADYVIVDSAPLGEVSDALRMVGDVSSILIVTQPGRTDRRSYENMRDLLERTPHAPSGLIVIGESPKTSATSYYHYALTPSS